MGSNGGVSKNLISRVSVVNWWMSSCTVGQEIFVVLNFRGSAKTFIICNFRGNKFSWFIITKFRHIT